MTAENLPAIPGDTDVAIPGPAAVADNDPGPELPGADTPGAGQLLIASAERRPVIPAPWRRENIRETLAVIAAVQWHRTRYHGLRAPLYAVALLFWAAIGAGRLAAAQLAWAWLAEQRELRADAVVAGDATAYRRLHKDAQDTRRTRIPVLAAEAAAIAGGCALLAAKGTGMEQAGVTAAAVPLLALAGRPEGRRIIAPAVMPPAYQVPTPELITKALGSLGISGINAAIKDGRGIQWVSDVHRDGPGWGVHLDLPEGITAAHIIARRRELSSGLRRPLSAVWPEGVAGIHEGRLALWIGFRDLAEMRQPKHPLLKAGTTDVFSTVPFGTDPRQRPVTVPMYECNWLIGAAPGQGKTAAVRNLCVAAALDVLCDLQIHELAGKGDLEPFEQVCTRYVSGLDDEAIAYAARSASLLRAELEARAAIFKQLPREAKRDGKVTRELARRITRLRPQVVVFDEAQNLFMHPEHGEQAAADLAHVMRLGRAYGLIVVLSTQRPESACVPTAITGVVTIRYALKVPDYLSNDLVLGTGSHKAGYTTVPFRAVTDAGLGWLKAAAEPQIVRGYYLDLPAAGRIAGRARQLREAAGALAGHALGVDDADRPEPRDVLADVLEVMGGAAGQHWTVLAQGLADRWPERWADLTHLALSAQCQALGVRSVTVSVAGQKDRGCRRVAVEAAMGEPVTAQVSGDGGNAGA